MHTLRQPDKHHAEYCERDEKLDQGKAVRPNVVRHRCHRVPWAICWVSRRTSRDVPPSRQPIQTDSAQRVTGTLADPRSVTALTDRTAVLAAGLTRRFQTKPPPSSPCQSPT